MTAARVSAVLTAVDPQAQWILGVVAKRTYGVANGQLTEASAQIGLFEQPVLAEDQLTFEHDTDLMLRKREVDVVITGHAYPHENDRRSTVEIRVGAFRRTLQVTGDRRIELDSQGRARFSPPERFERVSLGWERAYGGHDAAALETYGDPTERLRREAGIDDGPAFGLYAYPRNPAGRGYLVELTERAIELCRLPNLEDPARLLTPERVVYGNSLGWPGGPPPASTAWLPYSFFPRMTLLGFPAPPFDAEAYPIERFDEVRTGLIPERSLADDTHVATLHDLRAAQSSAPGMRMEAIAPGTPVTITHAHPQHASWSFALPRQPPKMMLRLANEAPREVRPAIRTLLIEPDEDRVCLVWVGEAAIDRPLMPEALAAVQHAVIWR